jgi:hypothetical protein
VSNRLPIPGGDDGDWGTILNDFLDVSLNGDGTIQTSAITAAGGVTSVNGQSPSSGSVTLTAGNVGAPTTLAGDSDVSLTSPSNGQGLLYNSGSSKWTNQTLPTAADATTSSKGVVELTNDLGGTAALPTVVSTHLSSALPINQGGTGSTSQNFVDLTTSQSIGGTKTFSGEVIVPAPTNTTDAATKHYVDTTVASGAPNATTSAPGLVQLSGDLSGTASAPTITATSNVETIISANTTVAGALPKSGGTMTGPIIGFEDKGGQVFNVKAYGATGNGSTDDTTAIEAAITAASVSGGIVYLPQGIYMVSSTLTINSYAVSLVGAGQSATTIMPTSGFTGDVIRWTIVPFTITPAGKIADLMILGTNCGNNACGIHVGDIVGARLDNVIVQYFYNTGSIGIHVDNVTSWTEEMVWTNVSLIVNLTNVLFDVNGGMASWDYNRIQIRVFCDGAQTALQFQGGGEYYNGFIGMTGNLTGDGAVAFNVVGTCYITDNLYDIAMEANGGTVTGLKMPANAAQLTGNGVIDLSNSSSGTFTSSSSGDIYNFIGLFQCPGISRAINGTGVIGGLGVSVPYAWGGNNNSAICATITDSIDTCFGVLVKNAGSGNSLELQDNAGNVKALITQGGSLTASNFSGSSSGTNTGDQTLSGLGGMPLTGGTFTGTVTSNLIIDSNNAVVVTANAGTCSAAYRLNTFTNSSAATMAITIATAGATGGQMMVIRIYDASGATETIGWTNTENSAVAAPTTSNGSTTLPLTVGFMFNSATTRWRCLVVA